MQGPDYSDRQTHTWTLTGGAPTVQGPFQVYPGSWAVVGNGSLSRSMGNQTLTAEWTTRASSSNAPIAVFVRASDRKMFIQSRHAQLRQAAAVQGQQQQVVSGVRQTPVPLSLEAFEWSFPMIAVSSPVPPDTNATAVGSSTSPVNGSVGPMQPAGSRVTAACTWQFGQGSAAPAPPPVLATSTATAPTEATVPTAPSAPPANSTPILTATPLDPAIVPLPALCTLRGPAPQSTCPASHATPVSAWLYWDVVPGATGYTISRADLGKLTASPLPRSQTSFLHRATLPAPGSYAYTITAHYENGCGSTVFNVAAQPLMTPHLDYRLEGTGAVRLRWGWGNDPLRLKLGDFSGVLVTGPTLPAAGRAVENFGISGDQLLMTGVLAGSRTWTVKAYWNTPAGRLMDDTGRTITVTVP